jgi:hypothetical protein
MACRIEKVLTRLTRQTWKEALSRLWALEEGGGHETIDVVDDAGEVGHACIFIDREGAWRARKGTPDPRNLYAKLRRSLRLKTLRLAVMPEAPL